MRRCDVCNEETMDFAILGMMHPNIVEGRDAIRVCDICLDTCPCGTKGDWWDGLKTCKHGYVYDKDYKFVNGKPVMLNTLVKRKWWSYLFYPRTKHLKLICQ